jgi:hypothetical protein
MARNMSVEASGPRFSGAIRRNLISKKLMKTSHDPKRIGKGDITYANLRQRSPIDLSPPHPSG